MASLTVIKGPDRGRRFELTGSTVSIGRDAKNDIRLHDGEISRHHAEIRESPDGMILCDNNSSNGTYLNNERVDTAPLRMGDRIRVGQTELIYSGDAPSPPSAADLAGRISVVTPARGAESSAIVRTIKQTEVSPYLTDPGRAESEWLKQALNNLAVIYETSRAVSRIADVGQLLDHIMDLVLKTVRADRGCVMLRDPDTGRLEPRAVRYAAGVNSEERISISHTITDWVLKRNEGAIVIDAAHDQRFSGAQSIVHLGIREAICAPMRGRHETLGVIYIDIKSDNKDVLKTQRTQKFTEDHLKLMIAIAHQAALAIEESRSYQAMMQAERLAAVGQTIATLSHHIKNILQGLRAGSYLVDSGLKDKHFAIIEQGWSVVHKNQEKMYSLVMDMLTFSKEREPSLEPTDPNQVASDVVELMSPRARELGVSLELKVDPNAPLCLLDSEGIHRALLNIVTNALDAVEGVENGRALVTVAVDESKRYLRLAVTDNGVGIPPDAKERIFQVFSSSKGSRGTGLGLAVSLKIAREHGGTIRVVSKEGQGSRFTIELPIRATSKSALPPPEPTLTDLAALREGVEPPKARKSLDDIDDEEPPVDGEPPTDSEKPLAD